MEENIEETTEKSAKGDEVNVKKRKQNLKENGFEDSKRQCIKFTCDDCQKTYSTRQSLKRHMSDVHKGLKPFKCTSCDSKFANGQGLKNHIAAIHGGKKPYQCQKCDSSFATNQGLKRHISSVHEEQKQFKCQKCQYACALKYNLDLHLNTVHGNDTTNCSKCNEEFTRKDLKKHEANCTRHPQL